MRNLWPGNDQRRWNGMDGKGQGKGGKAHGAVSRELPRCILGSRCPSHCPCLVTPVKGPCLSLSLAVCQSPESYPRKPLPGHFWTLRACSERAGIGLDRAKNSTAGTAVLSEHRKDPDIRNLVQRARALPAEKEERRRP